MVQAIPINEIGANDAESKGDDDQPEDLSVSKPPTVLQTKNKITKTAEEVEVVDITMDSDVAIQLLFHYLRL